MIKRLIEFKAFCEENFQKSQSDPFIDWNLLEKLLRVLTSVNVAILTLQEKNLLLSDFYKLWIELRVTLQTVNTNLSKTMFEQLKQREMNLLENENITAALFLDPRLRRILSKKKRKTAKHLKKIVMQICVINEGKRF